MPYIMTVFQYIRALYGFIIAAQHLLKWLEANTKHNKHKPQPHCCQHHIVQFHTYNFRMLDVDLLLYVPRIESRRDTVGERQLWITLPLTGTVIREQLLDTQNIHKD